MHFDYSQKFFILGILLPYHRDTWVVDDISRGLEGVWDMSDGKERHQIAGVASGQHERCQHPQPQHQPLPPPPVSGQYDVCVEYE